MKPRLPGPAGRFARATRSHPLFVSKVIYLIPAFMVDSVFFVLSFTIVYYR